MKDIIKYKKTLCVFVGLIFISTSVTFAQDEIKPLRLTVMPFKYVSVKGDVAKFRAVNWMNDGYQGGIKELSYQQRIKNKFDLFLEGHSIPKENDQALDFKLNKGDGPYIKADYASFRKYYDGTGGTYTPFSTYRVTTLADDLKIDNEHVFVEIGSATESEPGVSASFGRHTKDGRKSRLAWTAVKLGSVTRETGPSYQDIDEITDTVTLKANTVLSDVKLSGEQKFQFFHADSIREEKSLSTDAIDTAGNKFRRQIQRPESDLYTTTLRGEKWFLNDKDFVSLNYRYSNMDASEAETLTEYKADGTVFNFSNPKNKPNAVANTRYDAHTMVGNFLSAITDQFSFITKLKSEVLAKRGASTYPSESTSGIPNGIINTTDVSNVENKVYRFGENFSLRYNGIPKTSLYTELELEQTRNWIAEERNSLAGESAADPAEQLSRETITNIEKSIIATGARFTPNKIVNMNVQYRHKLEDNDFDDVYESVYNSGAKSAFFEDLNLRGDDATARIAFKPIQRVETAFRYQLQNNKYFSRVENEQEVKARTLNNIFSYDLNLQPIDPLYVTLSYSKTFSKTSTAAASGASPQIPGITANFNTWLASTSYSLTEKIALTNSLVYSLMRNRNENSSVVFFGNDHRSYDYTTGILWSVKKDFSIEPHYSYYAYKANQEIESGSDYSAHVFWVDAKLKW